jgi:hypothetical protein
MPNAIEPTTRTLQRRKNGSRQREATMRWRGSTNIPQLVIAQMTQTVPRKTGCALCVDCRR